MGVECSAKRQCLSLEEEAAQEAERIICRREEDSLRVNILLLGNASSSKISILDAYVASSLSVTEGLSSGDVKQPIVVPINGAMNVIELSIVDCKHGSNLKKQLKKANCVMVFYNVSEISKKSFVDVKTHWKPLIDRYRLPVVLCAANIDATRRCVTCEEGIALAKQLGNDVHYHEVSTKWHHGIFDAFLSATVKGLVQNGDLTEEEAAEYDPAYAHEHTYKRLTDGVGVIVYGDVISQDACGVS